MNPPVVFVVLQTGALANGGLQSITEVMRRLKHHRAIAVTNLDTDLAKSWRGHGIDVRVVAEQASRGLRHDPVGTLRTYRRYRRALGKIVRESGARVIHANDPLAFQLSVSTAKVGGKARIALNLRDTLDPSRRPPRLKYRAMFAAADHVFYLSSDMAERWRQVAPNAARAGSVTYSIVDRERFASSPPPSGKRPIVLVPGIFWQKKGQLDFIREVVPKLAERGIDTRFAGDFEPDANTYAAACADAARPFADRVRFLGFRTDLPELYRQSNVIAVPSRHEGLMRGMIEAMSCARPVVSFDVCSAREVLEEKGGGAGTVVALGDYAGMAQALIRYASDRDLQEVAGSAGSSTARDLFDPDKVVERYERVFRALGEQR